MKTKLFLALVCAILCTFTSAAAEGYAVYTPSNTTLTFYYGDKPSGAYSLNRGDNYPEWYNNGVYATATKVVFNSSFAQARPVSTAHWFHKMDKLTSITGMNYLNTSEVIYMTSMFSGCSSLTSLDLSGFKTSLVGDMGYMFDGCSSLTTLDLSSFNTYYVDNMELMFSECTNLKNLNVSKLNTLNVTNMMYMFYGCSSLTTLDLSSFNTSKVTNMGTMFAFCSNLKTIYAGSGWTTAAVTNSGSMFAACTSLVGGAGTTYSGSHTNASYAHIDGGPSNPGYFTDKNSIENYDIWINGERVTSLNCGDLHLPGTGGSISYNSSNKTLMLENATIVSQAASCIFSEIDGLKIKLIGTNSITISEATKVSSAIDVTNTTINGTGTLTVTASPGFAAIKTRGGGKTLTIDNVTSLAVNSNSFGIYASGPDSRLVIKGNNTYVDSRSDNSMTISEFKDLVMEDGLKITEPVGGYYNRRIYDANGNYTVKKVIISQLTAGLLGDLEGSGIVDVEDVNAAINIILKLNTMSDYPGNGDMDNSGMIDVEDVNAMINIILKL